MWVPEAITADGLLARVKLRAQIPSTEGRLTDAEILTIADDAIVSSLGRELYEADDGRWIQTAADVSLVASRGAYRIPSRAWAGGVDQAILVDASGNTTELEYVDRSDIASFGATRGVPWAFAILGDVVQLLPTPDSASYSLRLRYVRRPSRLVLVEDCGVVSIVAGATLTLTSHPSAWSLTPIDVDVIEAVHHGEALEDDVATAGVDASDMTRDSGTWTTTGAYAVLGASTNGPRSYVCEAGTSCVVQVPDVAIAYLADIVARDVCVALGDPEGSDRLAALAEQRRREMVAAVSERSRTRPKIVPTNSPLRVGMQRSRRWLR